MKKLIITFLSSVLLMGCEVNEVFSLIETEKLPTETERQYYIDTLEGCTLIDYTCDEGWSGFQDTKGCGCEKDKFYVAKGDTCKTIAYTCPEPAKNWEYFSDEVGCGCQKYIPTDPPITP